MSHTHFRRARVRIAPLFSAAVVVFLAGFSNETHSTKIAALSEAEDWYIPDAADFRPEYDRDRANQKVQTWNEYWGWIKSFYNGNILSPGWTRGARATVEVVESGAKQKELIKLANLLGKTISSDWAKDGKVCKISTADLMKWNGVLIAARRAENGSGDELRAALLQVSGRVATKLGLQPTWPRGSGKQLDMDIPEPVARHSPNGLDLSTDVTATTMGVGRKEIRKQKASPLSE
jgi:hypothetical protein